MMKEHKEHKKQEIENKKDPPLDYIKIWKKLCTHHWIANTSWVSRNVVAKMFTYGYVAKHTELKILSNTIDLIELMLTAVLERIKRLQEEMKVVDVPSKYGQFEKQIAEFRKRLELWEIKSG